MPTIIDTSLPVIPEAARSGYVLKLIKRRHVKTIIAGLAVKRAERVAGGLKHPKYYNRYDIVYKGERYPLHLTMAQAWALATALPLDQAPLFAPKLAKQRAKKLGFKVKKSAHAKAKEKSARAAAAAKQGLSQYAKFLPVVSNSGHPHDPNH